MNDSSDQPARKLNRVAILFSGGPAPAANAVISTAAVSFLRHGIEVIGIKHGYSGLNDFTSEEGLAEGRDYIKVTHPYLSRTRNSQGVMIGTARTNPGRFIDRIEDLDEPEKCAPLQSVYDGLRSLGVDGLISIGGDDTLKTANKFKLFQKSLPADAPRIPVVHLPKTIDNDYMGIDFTFGYFTAVDTLASELRNLLHDAEAGRTYYLAETMGRSAGWLAYGVAIAGEASMVFSVEDVEGEYAAAEKYTDSETGKTKTRPVMNISRVVSHIVRLMLAREEDGKEFGVIVLAEGLAEYLPMRYLKGIPRDDHGHISISHVNLGRMISRLVGEAYTQATGRTRKITGLQLGYEARCAKPHAFDVMLGSQLGVGAFLALVEEELDGVMVSVSGQLNLRYVPFEDLVDPKTLVTVVRHITTGSDFHRLARFLETHVNE